MAPTTAAAPNKHHLRLSLRPAAQLVDFSEPPIMVEVGMPEKLFYLNEKVVRASSSFFQTAMKPEWEKESGRIIKLPEDDPDVFNIYVNWLQTHKLFFDVEHEIRRFFPRLLNAYILGEKLLDEDFKDAITDVCAAFFCTPDTGSGVYRIFGTVTRKHLYDYTVSGAPLRRLFVRCISNWRKLSDCLKVTEPKELLYEVAMQLQARANGKSENFESIRNAAENCEFHEHAQGAENCYRNKRYQ